MTFTAKRWIHLAIGTFLMLFLGLIYAWSTFVAPLEEEFGWNRGQTSLTFTISIAFLVIGLISCGFISKTKARRAVIYIAAACALIGFVVCSQTNSLIGLYIFYGVFVGFSVGMANNAIVSTIIKWFPDKTGLASGIMMMGFGFGGLTLGRIAVGMFETFGWRNTFLTFGILFAIIMSIGARWIVLPPSEFVAPKSASKSAKVIAPAEDVPPSQVLRKKSFWLYIAWFTMMVSGGLMVIGHASPYAQDLGLTPALAAEAAGIFSICNGLGRVLCGFVFDKFGLRRSMLLTTCYIITASALLVVSNITNSVAIMIIGFIFAGLSYGGAPTTNSTFASSRFGMKNFSANYGIVSLGMISSAMLGPWLAGTLRASSGGYLSSFVIMICFGTCALIIWQFMKKSL